MTNIVDPTGVAFNAKVYVWTENQFSALPHEQGSTFQMLDATTQYLDIYARYTTPNLYKEMPILNEETGERYEAHTASGKLLTDSGATVDLNEAELSYSDVVYFTAKDPLTEQMKHHWVIKATTDTGESFYISNHGLKPGETYTVDAPVPGYYNAYQPEPSVHWRDGVISPLSNSDTGQRIDNAVTPESPLYFRSDGDLNEGSYMLMRAYDFNELDIYDLEGNKATMPALGYTLKVPEGHDRGTFKSFDNDNYINDGPADYQNPLADNDQYGEYIDTDGNVFYSKLIYQAEAGYVFQAPDGTYISVATISFEGVDTGKSEHNIVFTSAPFEAGVEYQVVQLDGSPGYNNPTPDLEVAFKYYDLIEPCFVSGALIKTETGLKAVEDLEVGEMVWTKDDGYQPIRWIGHSAVPMDHIIFNQNRRPIRIAKGAMGEGLPFSDLLVSRHHRMAIKSRIALRVEGVDTVLVEAKELLEMDGVEVVNSLKPVVYHHILFDKHQIIEANGCETESLFTGPEALRTVSGEARDELLQLFPELADTETLIFEPAASIVKGKRARNLVSRHIKKATALQ